MQELAIAALPDYLSYGVQELKNEIELIEAEMIPLTRDRLAHLEASLKIVYQRLENHFYASKC